VQDFVQTRDSSAEARQPGALLLLHISSLMRLRRFVGWGIPGALSAPS
jgi:hypothetical protein